MKMKICSVGLVAILAFTCSGCFTKRNIEVAADGSYKDKGMSVMGFSGLGRPYPVNAQRTRYVAGYTTQGQGYPVQGYPPPVVYAAPPQAYPQVVYAQPPAQSPPVQVYFVSQQPAPAPPAPVIYNVTQAQGIPAQVNSVPAQVNVQVYQGGSTAQAYAVPTYSQPPPAPNPPQVFVAPPVVSQQPVAPYTAPRYEYDGQGYMPQPQAYYQPNYSPSPSIAFGVTIGDMYGGGGHSNGGPRYGGQFQSQSQSQFRPQTGRPYSGPWYSGSSQSQRPIYQQARPQMQMQMQTHPQMYLQMNSGRR